MKYVRWLLAAGCLAICIWLVMMALKSSEAVAAAHAAAAQSEDPLTHGAGAESVGPLPLYILGMVAFLAGVLLMVPEVVGRFIGMIGNGLTGLILPNQHSDKPVLTYTLAHRYVETERFPEAVEEYERLIHFYPDEKDAYVELLSAAVQGGDMKTYKKYAKLLKKRFNCEIELAYGDEEGREGEAGEEIIEESPPTEAEGESPGEASEERK